MKHLTEDDVLVWLLSSGALPVDMEQHAKTCGGCTETIRSSERFRAALGDPSTWEEQPHVGSDDRLLVALQELEERLDRERSEADTIVRELSSEQIERHVTERGSTVGLVRTLIDRSFEQVEREPTLGERYAALAILAADQLRTDDYRGDMVPATRGQAWRQMANAHRMSGQFSRTLADLDQAAMEFEQTTVPEPELATIDYIRATVYYTQGRLREARELLDHSSSVFRRYGDEQRYRNSRLLLAIVLERDGDRQEAIELLRTLLRETETGDTIFRGRILLNLGVTLLHDGQSEAQSHLRQAHHCLLAAGLRTEALRALWNLGRAVRQSGEIDRAAEILEEAYEEAAVLGLQIDVAMIALDRVELYLARDEHSLVEDLCQEALRTFRSADAPRFAAEAFAYLQTAAKQQQLSPADLTFVRDFFTTATTDRDRPFTPPN